MSAHLHREGRPLPDTYQANDSDAPDRRAHADARRRPACRKTASCSAASTTITRSRREMFDIWMRLLRGSTGSVLWLLEDNATAARNLRREADDARRRAGAAGLRAARASVAEHLARHRLADLFLDTLPYNAHTTASDALWAGLPVLTCLGPNLRRPRRGEPAPGDRPRADHAFARRIRSAGAAAGARSGLSATQGKAESQPRYMPALRYAALYALSRGRLSDDGRNRRAS